MRGKQHLGPIAAFVLVAACAGARGRVAPPGAARAGGGSASDGAAEAAFVIGKPPCASSDACRDGCERGSAEACLWAGRFEEPGDMASRLYHLGCKLGSQEACMRRDAAQGDNWAMPLGDMERACARGAAEVCERLGWAYQRGLSVPVDAARGEAYYRRAAERFEAACEAGSGLDCSGAAALYEDGAGVARSPALADTLYARACDLGDVKGCERSGASTTSSVFADRACKDSAPGACNRVGLRFEIGREIDLDPVRAVAAYKKACDAQDAHGCALLGFVYEVGMGGVARDRVRADELYEKACEHGDMQGCYSRARLHYEGSVGITRDLELVSSLYLRACTGSNDGLGCRELTEMYERGEARNTEGTAVIELYARACDKGDALACSRGAALLAEGKKVQRDAGRALTLYDRACALGDGPGCFAGGKIYLVGDLVGKDEDEAQHWFERGCAAGDSESCVQGTRRLDPIERLKDRKKKSTK